MSMTAGTRRAIGVALTVALCLGLAACGGVVWFLDDRLGGGHAAGLTEPPSERGPGRDRRLSGPRPGSTPAATSPSAVPPADPAESPPSNGPTTSIPTSASRAAERGVADGYETLDCVFEGSAVLDPGVAVSLLGGGSPQRMSLSEGAAFRCEDPPGSTAGQVELDASFGSLSAWSGVGEGKGWIRWEELPPERLGDADPSRPTSRTLSEVELIYPEIIVWLTILEGPYAGFRGKLVLDSWELVKDDTGRIVELVFDPTDFELSTV